MKKVSKKVVICKIFTKNLKFTTVLNLRLNKTYGFINSL